MAATTAITLKQLILIRILENDPNGTIAGSLDALWDMYADKALIAPRLQYFSVLTEVYNLKIAAAFDCGADSKDIALKVQTWLKQRDSILVDIAKLEKQYAGNRTGVSGTLTTTAPISSADDARTAGAFDANSREFRGDAYLPGFSSNGRLI